MKQSKLISCLFLSALLSACGSDEKIEFEQNLSDKVEVSIGVVTSDNFTTKTLGVLDGNTDNVEAVQIYVFRESGDLDAFAQGKNNEEIKLDVTKGVREFFAVANPQPVLTGITKKDVFLKSVAKLEKEKSSSLLMVGTAGTKDIQNAQNIQITVGRFVSRIQLQYNVDLKGTPWEGKKFTPDSVYITNANSEAIIESGLKEEVKATTLTHGGWFGQNCNLCNVNDGNWGETPVAIGGEKWFSYYVYKNDKPASAKFADVTSLVISGYIEGNDQLQYYTVRINTPDANITGGSDDAKHKYVQNNVIYGIRATIKGTGTDEPGVDPINFHVTVVAKPWTEIWQDIEFK